MSFFLVIKRICFAFLSVVLIASAQDKVNSNPLENNHAYIINDLTIIVPSCDKYEDLWDNFFKLLFEKWPSLLKENKHIPIVFSSNKKAYQNPRVQNIQIPNEQSWSDNMLEIMKHVKTRYVIIRPAA